MTVGELIKHLSAFPQDMEVIREYMSDYDDINAEDQWCLVYGIEKDFRGKNVVIPWCTLREYPDVNSWCNVVEAVRKDDWLMRAHETMSKENKDAKKLYLCLGGN